MCLPGVSMKSIDRGDGADIWWSIIPPLWISHEFSSYTHIISICFDHLWPYLSRPCLVQWRCSDDFLHALLSPLGWSAGVSWEHWSTAHLLLYRVNGNAKVMERLKLVWSMCIFVCILYAMLFLLWMYSGTNEVGWSKKKISSTLLTDRSHSLSWRYHQSASDNW